MRHQIGETNESLAILTPRGPKDPSKYPAHGSMPYLDDNRMIADICSSWRTVATKLSIKLNKARAQKMVAHNEIARTNAGYLVGSLQAPQRHAGGSVNILN